ncbi:hypothetical protein T11_17555 [Trichinella zimbabwensis]|uniref:Uncharacterized protein n=1 Tax=Trichinella zimbabwensis TaxID=268475 RepID=A0A0V1H5L5_9BILA|nr:hypothetical protein T11_17555 [Trichinella zimbabwensis]
MIQRLRQYLDKYAFMQRKTRIFKNCEISRAIALAVLPFFDESFIFEILTLFVVFR